MLHETIQCTGTSNRSTGTSGTGGFAVPLSPSVQRQEASSELRSSEANLCRTAHLTGGGWERLLTFLYTVLKGNRLFMGPVLLLLLLLLEVALYCPVIVLYPTRSHWCALFRNGCNSPAPTRVRKQQMQPLGDKAGISVAEYQRSQAAKEVKISSLSEMLCFGLNYVMEGKKTLMVMDIVFDSRCFVMPHHPHLQPSLWVKASFCVHLQTEQRIL